MLVGHEIVEISNSLREQEANKLDKIMGEKAFQLMCPPVLTQLILNILIDKAKIHDRDYLLSQIENYSKEGRCKDAFYVVTIHQKFVEAAKDAIEADRKEVAIILILTAIEHVLNNHYRYLMRYQKIPDDVIYFVIRQSKIRDKVNGLLASRFGLKLDKSLLKDIYTINEIRNAIIHYKSVPVTFIDVEGADSFSKIQNDIQKINLNNMLLIPKKLNDLLMAQTVELFPELLLIKEIMNTIFDDEFTFEFEHK